MTTRRLLRTELALPDGIVERGLVLGGLVVGALLGLVMVALVSIFLFETVRAFS